MNGDRSMTARPVSGQPDTTPRFYTVHEYAILTCRCDEAIRQRIRDGRIEAVRGGRGYLIPMDTLERELVPAQRDVATACPGGDA